MCQTFINGKPWLQTSGSNCPCDDCEHFPGISKPSETCDTCIGEGPYSGIYDYRHFKEMTDNEDGE